MEFIYGLNKEVLDLVPGQRLREAEQKYNALADAVRWWFLDTESSVPQQQDLIQIRRLVPANKDAKLLCEVLGL